MKLTTCVITKEQSWLDIRQQWEALYAATEHAGPPMIFSWMWRWWEKVGSHYCKGNDTGLRIVVVQSLPGRIHGIFPFYRRTRTWWSGGSLLAPLGTGEDSGEVVYPEILHPLVDPDYSQECFALLERELASNPLLAANQFTSGIVIADSPFAKFYLSLSDSQFGAITTTEIPSILCNIEGGVEAYLARLGGSRKAFRRQLKEAKIQNLGFGWASTTSEALRWFDELVAIHQSRWQAEGKSGAFATERVLDFHRAVITDLLPRGEVMVSRLSLNDRPLALLYGFVKDEKIDVYQSAVVADNDSSLRSAGIVSHLLTMDEAARRGIRTYDLLGWETEYKRRFATGRLPLIEASRQHASVATVLQRTTNLAQRAAQRLRETTSTFRARETVRSPQKCDTSQKCDEASPKCDKASQRDLTAEPSTTVPRV